MTSPQSIPTPGDAPPRLQLVGITKRYPAVVANDGVSLTVQPGEVHAVLGENGAGKSTLMKIIYGTVKPDEGQVLFDGQPVYIRNPQEARQLGIAMVFQHFSLFDTLTVAENVWLGLDKSMSLAEVTRRIESKGAEYGMDIDPSRPVHTLSVGEMQRVEIIRALLTDPRVLILDEPTSVLTPQAVEKLFVVLKKLASEGCSILYISHKLHEIRELCTACTVLRGGKVTGYCNPQEESNASLSRLMIGAEPAALQHRAVQAGAAVLRVQGLSLAKQDQFGVDLVDMHFEVRAGEVVGIAGVSGNGQQELLYALSGEDTRAEAGMVQVAGQAAGRMNPRQRRALGLHFVPEERLGRGAVPAMGLAHNMLLTRDDAVGQGGWLSIAKLEAHAADIIRRFGVKAGGPNALAKSLSGGNLQKFIMGREIGQKPEVLVVEQPTWGGDAGAAAAIRQALVDLAARGSAIVVISQDLDELLELADRLCVINEGRLSEARTVAGLKLEEIGLLMGGVHGEAVAADHAHA